MYTYLITGTEGMHKAVWKKFDKANFGCSCKRATRPMHGWEAILIEVLDEMEDPYSIVLKTIGDRLSRSYMIQVD